MSETITIAGAGPAGLAAAITLARAGRHVIVHEAQGEVGYRFQGDFQGLENWTTEQDALDRMRDWAMPVDFKAQPFKQGVAFDAWGRRYAARSEIPLFYMVERGPGPASLDSALLRQAQALGVEVRFNSRLDRLEGPGILATGPKTADAIAVGYHFDTPMDDGFWVICDNALAPQGYAYLLIMQGRGTVKSCMFSGFKQEKRYVERTVAAFRRLVGLEMVNATPHGGAGNFRIPQTASSGTHLAVGEQAGFQDTLWGFGIRLAMGSGVLAARSLMENDDDYHRRWQQQIAPQMQASVVNRVFYSMLGNYGYRWFLRYWTHNKDTRQVIGAMYQPSRVKHWLLPWAKVCYESRRKDASCDHVDCGCIWCRHGSHA